MPWQSYLLFFGTLVDKGQDTVWSIENNRDFWYQDGIDITRSQGTRGSQEARRSPHELHNCHSIGHGAHTLSLGGMDTGLGCLYCCEETKTTINVVHVVVCSI